MPRPFPPLRCDANAAALSLSCPVWHLSSSSSSLGRRQSVRHHYHHPRARRSGCCGTARRGCRRIDRRCWVPLWIRCDRCAWIRPSLPIRWRHRTQKQRRTAPLSSDSKCTHPQPQACWVRASPCLPRRVNARPLRSATGFSRQDQANRCSTESGEHNGNLGRGAC